MQSIYECMDGWSWVAARRRAILREVAGDSDGDSYEAHCATLPEWSIGRLP